MKYFISTLAVILLFVTAGAVASPESSAMTATTPDTASVKVLVHTTAGDMTLLLYGDTPKHRDNFVKLVNEGYYDGVLFHRVIKDFMIQTGDPDSKGAPAGKRLGMGGPGYQIDAEIVYPEHYHKRGALAAARQGDATNPQRRSSGSQFYIVTGRKLTPPQLARMEQELEMKQKQEVWRRLLGENRDKIMALQQQGDTTAMEALRHDLIARMEAEVAAHPAQLPEALVNDYKKVGGAPHLDGEYTIFGEVVDGMDVVDAIEGVATDGADRPLEDVKVISMKVLK